VRREAVQGGRPNSVYGSASLNSRSRERLRDYTAKCSQERTVSSPMGTSEAFGGGSGIYQLESVRQIAAAFRGPH
jgi:hypothetical protein